MTTKKPAKKPAAKKAPATKPKTLSKPGPKAKALADQRAARAGEEKATGNIPDASLSTHTVAIGDAPPAPAADPKAGAPLPTPPAVAPIPQTVLTALQIKNATALILLYHADHPEGEAEPAKLVEFSKRKLAGWWPDLLADLIKAGLLVEEADKTVLSSSGWKRVVDLRQEMNAVELERVTTALTAHQRYAQLQNEIQKEIDAAESGVEEARGLVRNRKETLAEKHKKMSAFIAGGVQTTIIDKGGKIAAPAENKGALVVAGWEAHMKPVREGQTIIADNKLPKLKVVRAAVVQPIVFNGGKKKIAKEQVLTVFETPMLATAIHDDAALNETRVNLVRLYSTDEWTQIKSEKYGHFVAEYDKNDETKETRQKGGPWCGLMIHAGNKPWIVGDQDEALHVIFKTEEKKPAKAADVIPFDAKAAAAGDKPSAEVDEEERKEEDRREEEAAEEKTAKGGKKKSSKKG